MYKDEETEEEVKHKIMNEESEQSTKNEPPELLKYVLIKFLNWTKNK